MKILLQNELFHSKTKKKIKTFLEILYNWGNPGEIDWSILKFCFSATLQPGVRKIYGNLLKGAKSETATQKDAGYTLP
jgi:hypothetical protein